MCAPAFDSGTNGIFTYEEGKVVRKVTFNGRRGDGPVKQENFSRAF